MILHWVLAVGRLHVTRVHRRKGERTVLNAQLYWPGLDWTGLGWTGLEYLHFYRAELPELAASLYLQSKY